MRISDWSSDVCSSDLGFITDQHCHAANKMRMIHAAGYGEIAIAYSDSRADLPLLHAASHPVVVNPKESAVEGFRRVLPTGTPVLNWGCEGRAGRPDAGEPDRKSTRLNSSPSSEDRLQSSD